MEDVSDCEIVAEGGDYQCDRGDDDCSENYNSGAARSFAETLPTCVPLKEESHQAHSERINAQRQGEEQGKTTNLRHVGEPQCIFSETHRAGKVGVRLAGTLNW